MPKLTRRLPKALLHHLIVRAIQREFQGDTLHLVKDWVSTNPEVPKGHWFIRLPGIIVCGRDEYVLTFLTEDMIPTGTEVKT